MVVLSLGRYRTPQSVKDFLKCLRLESETRVCLSQVVHLSCEEVQRFEEIEILNNSFINIHDYTI